MKKNIVLISMIGLALMILISSCMENEEDQKDGFPKILELVRDSNAVHVGNLTPYEVTVEDKIASIAFVETPVGFTIHLTDKKSLLGVELLKSAINKGQTLKIFIAKHCQEIVQINQLDDDGTIKYVRKIGTRYPGIDEPASAEFYVDQIRIWGYKVPTFEDCFKYGGGQNVNWSYIGEGCYARAHDIYRNFIKHGFMCMKIFAYGNGLKAYSPSEKCYAYWKWHVAVFVVYTSSPESKKYMMGVIDPSLQTDSPIMPYKEWLTKLSLSESHPVFVAMGNLYISSPDGRFNYYDDHFEHTDCVLGAYRHLEGCDYVPHGCNLNLCSDSIVTPL